jgi:hypothetical protein
VGVALLGPAACGDDHPDNRPVAPDSGTKSNRSDGSGAAGGSDSAVISGGNSDAGADTGPRVAIKSDSGADAVTDDGGKRGYYLASTGAQLLVSGPRIGLQLTSANLAEDVDVIAIHQEFYGIPWEAFEKNQPVPSVWGTLMGEIAHNARAAGKPIFLSVTMLNGTRSTLAARTVINQGKVETEDNWSATCYNFASAADGASKKTAYLRYVESMIDTFQPRYLNIAVEVNLFFEKCPQATAALIDVANAAYDLAKKKDPTLIVFPSIQIDHLYGYSEDSCPKGQDKQSCFDSAYAQLSSLKRDRFAISSYPFLQEIGPVSNIAADWFTRGATRGNERSIIAETGWLSTRLTAKLSSGQCLDVKKSDQTEQATYLDFVLRAAQDAHIDLVTWWSNRDLLDERVMTDCPCSFDTAWCAVVDLFRTTAPLGGGTEAAFYGEVLMKAFGTMGIRDYTGKPKERVFARWHDAAQLSPEVHETRLWRFSK